MNKKNIMKYLSCHCACTEAIYNQAMRTTASDIENARDQKTSRIRSMISAVRLEVHKMRGYVRLSPLGDKTLYGYMRPKHNIGEMVSNIMAHRYPNMIIVLGNSNKSWISLYTSEGISYMSDGPLEKVVEKLGQLTKTSGEKTDIEGVWDVYYKSQYRPERRNLKYFHQNMTLTSMRSVRPKPESNKNGATLDSFME
ncbi:MAG TPA: DUF4130 domain-containing protein [Candidatus Methanofastidiosa archaeon]|nr:DUF4130 domain-containing protein [Candidatus Methanofastidiosa archaeon]HPR41093.1 DUF4130 domain-containing protein [Candidatus Methanofastidiosa archaeon]